MKDQHWAVKVTSKCKMKTCTKCKIEKPLTEFGVHAASKCGINPCCRACNSAAASAYYAANTGKVKVYRAVNIDKLRVSSTAYRVANASKIRLTKAAWRASNPEKVRATKATSYAANKDKYKASCARYRASNPTKVAARLSAYYHANIAVIKEYQAAYNAANHDKISTHKRNYKAKKHSSGKLSQGLSAKLFQIQRGKCTCCNQPLGDNFHLDHIMPIALGGSNTDDNIQLLRQRCNNQKHAKHPVDFMQSRGFLI